MRLVAGLGQPLLDVVERADGGLVLGVEALLAGVEPGDPGLEGGEVALGALGAGHGLLAGQAEPADLVVGGGGPGLERVDLTVQPGQALATVGGGALQPGDPALLLGGGVLGGAARGHGLLEGGAVGVDLGGDLLLLLADPLGLGLELRRGRDPSRTPRPRRCRRRCGPARRPATGCRAAARAARRARTRSPGPRDSAGRSSRRAASRAASCSRAAVVCGLHLLAALDQDRLVGHLLLERGAGGDQVVGQQPGPGVAHVGLHARRPCGPPRPGGPAA